MISFQSAPCKIDDLKILHGLYTIFFLNNLYVSCRNHNLSTTKSNTNLILSSCLSMFTRKYLSWTPPDLHWQRTSFDKAVLDSSSSSRALLFWGSWGWWLPPASCGSSLSTSYWFRLPVPPSTLMSLPHPIYLPFLFFSSKYILLIDYYYCNHVGPYRNRKSQRSSWKPY